MAGFKVASVHEFSAEIQIAFRSEHHTAPTLHALLSRNGRLFAVRHHRVWLHHRGMRGPGGKRIRMRADVFKQIKVAAYAAIACKALGHDITGIPVQEINL
jgi:hypothetical protein